MLFYNEYENVCLKCDICLNESHLLLKCPLLSINFNKRSIINKYLYSIPQTRRNFDRKSDLSIKQEMH